MKTALRTAILLLALGSTACASLFRTESFIRGTVVDVGNGWLDLRHKSGRVVRVVTTTASTGAAAGLKPDVRVFVELEGSGKGPLVARDVLVVGNP